MARELTPLRCQRLSTREALKVLVRCSPALPSLTYHDYILFPQEYVLDIRQFHFQPTPHPHSLSCSGPWCSLFPGGARRGVWGGPPIRLHAAWPWEDRFKLFLEI